ncbi:glycosyl transferase family 1 [Paractinoplanes abujensis]|uniref:Glycosyltransferase involved in cell wall biosynthesis n=1 Tax=Paractinoplanes abujensis TaxID=882441 RepID=A0A7W7D1F5_9ACTN|nr:glycosyltransferase [Actinoplanes abujensis]MBB4698371.1 glycosyltransferase involved in cell wall biosynthesis [Actinoplanes abujensis]GID19144.1 glycosyl transferase family 1 [Actinoplanes abujensis]
MSRRRRTIAVIAPLRHPIREPHAGGLEAMVWDRVRMLRARGHRVLLCAVEGSQFLEDGPAEFRLPAVVWPDERDATDSTFPPGHLERALPALEAALDFIRRHRDTIDLVDNHSLHPQPLTWAGRLGVPVVTTLHTPPLPRLVAAARSAQHHGKLLAVSAHTAAEWREHGVEARVMPNAVDADRWRLGPGGRDLVWFGRIVPEKGVHVAVQAARLTGRRLRIAGRVGDVAYFQEHIRPFLGRGVDYLGPLGQPELADLVGSSACALVTPLWPEPFGLVIAEALATGTPVAAFDTGGVGEVAGTAPAVRLVPMGDAEALARAAGQLASGCHRDRRRTRAEALARFSLDRRAAELETIFDQAGADAWV